MTRAHTRALPAILGCSLLLLSATATAQTSSDPTSNGSADPTQTPSGNQAQQPDQPEAQPEEGADEPKGEQKMNAAMADLSLGVIGVAYERVIFDPLSINIAFQYYRPWYESDHVFGFGGELRPVFWMTDRGPEGFYFSPGLRLAYARADLSEEGGGTEEGFAWAYKATIGYSALVREILILRAGAGVQSHQADLVDGAEDPDFSGPYPAVDLYIGAAF